MGHEQPIDSAVVTALNKNDPDDPSTWWKPARGDGWFDPWWCAEGDALGVLIIFLSGVLIRSEKKRRRKRKKANQEKFDDMLELVVCNLVVCVLEPGAKGRIAYSRSKAGRKGSRYSNPRISAVVLPRVVDALQDIGMLKTTKGTAREMSTMTPMAAFRKRLDDFGVTLADLGRREDEEVIILKGRLGESEHDSEDWLARSSATKIEYKDNSYTNSIRSFLKAYNAFLKRADIAFVDDGKKPPIATARRHLTRFFTQPSKGHEPFQYGGRFFGGWWINMERVRRSNIRIEGQLPADIDFSAMNPRLAYAGLGVQPPKGDLYDLTGFLKGYVPELHRKAVKQVLSAMFFKNTRERLPKGTRDKLPKGTTMKIFAEAVDAKHPALKEAFGTSIGYKLMYLESEIMALTMERLTNENVVALPVHDGLLVAESFASIAQDVMEQASREVCGYPIPTSCEVLG